VSPANEDSGQPLYGFIDIVSLKVIPRLEHHGLEDNRIIELLEKVSERLSALEDHLADRVLTVFEDRIIVTQKNRFVDSRVGSVLLRLDLNEVIEESNRIFSRTGPERTSEEWFQEGLRYMATSGASEQALAAFQEVLKLEPNRAEAYANIGKIHHREHRLVDAERAFRMALLRDPYHPEAYYYLGRVMEDLNCLDEAIACYDKALEINPDLKSGYYRMGRACAKAQLWERALKHWNYYLMLDPDSPRSDLIRRQIKELSLLLTE